MMRSTVLMTVVALLLACGGASRTGDLVVEDGSGRVVRLAAPAKRVISLIPSVTEVLVAMGAADRLVARTDYDNAPVLAHLPIGRLRPTPRPGRP